MAGISGAATSSGIDSWYNTLIKPSFNPPAYIFGPVWAVLYTMTGIAGGLIWGKREQHCVLLVWFTSQLALSFLWPFLFFAAGSIGWALTDIVLMWIILLITLINAYRHYRPFGYWLTPYFLWVSFAVVLNTSLWALN